MKRFKVPVFDAWVCVSTDTDPSKAKTQIGTFINGEVDGWESSDAFVVCNGSRLGLWLGPNSNDGILAHECVHLAEGILEYIGSDRGKELEEIRATLVGYLFNKIKNALETKKPTKQKTS